MIGTVLRELHSEIRVLADPGGHLELGCPEAEPSPFLLANRRFVCDADAERAARAARLYWAFLRRLDPTLGDRHPTITSPSPVEQRNRPGAGRTEYEHVPDAEKRPSPRSVERDRQHIYIQELLGLLLELLAVRECRSGHREFLGTYLRAGGSCPHTSFGRGCALLSMAIRALADDVGTAGQSNVLQTLVRWLSPPEPRTASPVRAALEDLSALGLLTRGTAKHLAKSGADRNGQWRVRLDEYVFFGNSGEVLAFPFALEVARNARDCSIAITDVRVEGPRTVSFAVSLDPSDPAGVLIPSTVTE